MSTVIRPRRSAAIRASLRPGNIIRNVFAVLLAVFVIGVPVWLVLATSAKTAGEAQKPSLSLPLHWEGAQNYATVFDQGKILEGLIGSVVVVVPSVVGVLILGSMAAWVLGRRGGPLSAGLYALLISGILMPPAVVTIVLELRFLHIAETQLGLIAVYMGMFLSIATFFMTGFVRTIPRELEEAARVDGAGSWRIYSTIILPLLRPVIATAAILVTLFAWNDIFYAFFVLGGSSASTLPLNLYQVASAQLYLNNWQLIFAYIVLMSAPLIVVFLLGQRRIVSGLTSGAVK